MATRGKRGGVPAQRRAEPEPTSDHDLGGILSKLPPNTPPEVIEMISQSEFMTGPLPPPVMLEHYEGTLPGLADRIMKLAENEQAMRSRDNAWILSNDTIRVLGSLAVSLALIAAGVYCGVIGQPWLGGFLARPVQ